MIKEYRKKTTIKAERFDGSDEMIEKYGIKDYGTGPVLDELEGEFAIKTGDWIATGIDGERWAIAGDIFRRTYEEADDNDC